MKKAFLLMIVAVVVVVGVMLTRDGGTPDIPISDDVEATPTASPTAPANATPVPAVPTAAPTSQPTPQPTPLGTPVATEAPSPQVREFRIDGKNFEFSQEAMSVRRGDTVRIVFTSTGGFHDWRVEGYNVGTQRVDTGGSATVEFVADTAGTFEYFCSVGNHRALGMEGVLTVTN